MGIIKIIFWYEVILWYLKTVFQKSCLDKTSFGKIWWEQVFLRNLRIKKLDQI